MKQDNEKRQINILDRIIKFILLIVIIILLIHNCCLMKKNNKQRIPTGNVEIIEIKCNPDRCEDNPETKINQFIQEANDTINRNNNSSNNNESPSEEEEEKEDEELKDYEFGVVDSNHNKITWNGATDLKIFTNSMYELDGIIAPEDSNTYLFVVKNGTEYKLDYDLTFIETNESNINMKYKLKKNDTYLVDHYVSYDELTTLDQQIEGNSKDTYFLEWKWVSSSNDTEIGASGTASYKLEINVEAESIDE